jgi:hypothetical protein
LFFSRLCMLTLRFAQRGLIVFRPHDIHRPGDPQRGPTDVVLLPLCSCLASWTISCWVRLYVRWVSVPRPSLWTVGWFILRLRIERESRRIATILETASVGRIIFGLEYNVHPLPFTPLTLYIESWDDEYYP